MANSLHLVVPVGATATKLAAPGVGSGVTVGDTYVFFNSGTVTVLLGGPDVSTTNGFRGLVAGASLAIDVLEDIFGVVSGATAGAVDVLRAA